MTQLKNNTVLITGGARGIGYLVAERALKKGSAVVLWDIDEAALTKAVAKLGAGAHGYAVDITDRHAVYAAADRVREEVGGVDVLINNAGIVTGKQFLELSDEMIERTFQVNALALFWTARAFLPDMVKRNRGHIVTVASAAGLVGVPKLADYCASKFAAVGFDESLRIEMKLNSPGVKTTLVCPFYINTGMFEGISTKIPWLLPMLEEKDVARDIIYAIETNRQRLFLPPIVQSLIALKALPTNAVDFLMNVLGVNSTMDGFKGRSEPAKDGNPATAGARASTPHRPLDGTCAG